MIKPDYRNRMIEPDYNNDSIEVKKKRNKCRDFINRKLDYEFVNDLYQLCTQHGMKK